jgi:tRNA threonylcarbamoyladenosine biosynthesis protein TsaE
MNHEPTTMNQKPETRNQALIITTSATQTRRLGREIGRRLKAGAVIRLIGDLGSGKTCLVQGLAGGLDVPAGYVITSPTYTLIHEYPGRLPLAHVDLYRIHDEMDAEAIGLWELMDPNTVVAVEWAERLADDFWPDERLLTITFQSPDADTRQLELFGCGLQISDLIKEISSFGKDAIS